MAKKGKTRCAVLGMLALAPMSGYDIKRHFERCLSSIWTESYGKIYPVLKELLEEGLVSDEVQRQAGRPDRVVYSLTASGQVELAEWLPLDADTRQVRDEQILKVLFGHMGPVGVTASHLQTFSDRCQQKIEEAREFAKFTSTFGDARPQAKHMAAVADYVIMVNEASIRWAEQTVHRLVAEPELEAALPIPRGTSKRTALSAEKMPPTKPRQR
jgi:PadR family transcriptional regulator, regulatory protein AphA